MTTTLAARVAAVCALAAYAMLVLAFAFAAIALRRGGVALDLVGVAPILGSLLAAATVSLAAWRLGSLVGFGGALGWLALLALIAYRADQGLAAPARDLVVLLSAVQAAAVGVVAVAFGTRALRRGPLGLWSAYGHATVAAWFLYCGVLFA